MKKRIISSLLVIMMLFAVPMVSAYAAEGTDSTKKIYLSATQFGWENASAYFWSDDNTSFMSFPGKEMSLQDGLFTVDAPSQATKVIFSTQTDKGRIQTGTISLVDGKPEYNFTMKDSNNVYFGEWVELSQTYTKSGYVEENNVAVEGVKVQVLSGDTVIAEDITNNDGHFNVSCPEGEYNITFTKDGYQTTTTTFSVSAANYGEANEYELVKAETVQTYTKSGYVEENNVSIAGVNVEVLSGATVVATDVTSKDGHFSVSCPEGYYTLKLTKDGYHTATFDFNVSSANYGEANEYELVKADTYTKSGYLVSNSTPITNAEVELYDEFFTLVDTTTTGKDGHFSFSCQEGEYTVKFIKDGYQTTTSEFDVAAASYGEANEYYMLKVNDTASAGTVTGYVESNNYPVENATVTLKQDNKTIGSVNTNKDGYFSFEAIDGDYQIVVSHNDYNTSSTDVTVSEYNHEALFIDLEIRMITIGLDASSANWDTASVYYWNSYFGEMTQWPGTKMEKQDGNFFLVEIPANATNVIFTNGTTQTVDLTVNHDTPCFELNTKNDAGQYTGDWTKTRE